MVRVAIAGAGFWGMNHARVLSDLKDCELVGICDIDIGRARRAAEKYRVEAYFNDFETMLKQAKPEAITICTPSTSHVELTISSLHHGLDVLVEKPMATSAEEALKILSTQEKVGRLVMVGFIERFNPAVRLAVELLSNDEIGQIILTYSRRIGWWPERIGDVGVVKDTAVHDIDLTMMLFGETPESISARVGRLKHRYEDHAQIFLTFSTGRSAIIEANWLTPRKKREIHITGERGVISVKFIEQELVIEKEDYVRIPNIKYSEPLRMELEHFIQCVKTSTKPMVDVVDGYRASLIADIILESAALNRQIKVIDYLIEKRLPNP